MKRSVHIDSYFSLPTDLAEAFRHWTEFVGGSGYDVDLRSDRESVSVRYQQTDATPFLIMIAFNLDVVT